MRIGLVIGEHVVTALTSESARMIGPDLTSAAVNPGMLLVLPLPFRLGPYGLMAEYQAENGIRRWVDEFGSLTLAAPVIPEALATDDRTTHWIRPTVAEDGRVRLVPLPWGYKPYASADAARQARSTLEPLIVSHRYLQFAIGGCTSGDWGGLAARLAQAMGRPYAVHTDWVTHAMETPDGWSVKAVRQRLNNWRMRRAERQVITRASLGLFHGADCHEGYKNWCRNAELVHDIHVSPTELPGANDISRKRDRVNIGGPLRIIYAGRAAAMKGPGHWLDTMSQLHATGVPFTAEWYGDGPELERMRDRIKSLGLGDIVKLPGMIKDRQELLTRIRNADLLVFCHLTPESPRVLIEALNQATPIVGFASPYPADLTREGGGVLVEQGDVHGIAEQIKALNQDRNRLSSLIGQAGEVGRHLTDKAVFHHRAELIRRYLP